MIEEIKELLKDHDIDGRKAAALAKKIIEIVERPVDDGEHIFDCRPASMRGDDRRTKAVVSTGEMGGEIKAKS